MLCNLKLEIKERPSYEIEVKNDTVFFFSPPSPYFICLTGASQYDTESKLKPHVCPSQFYHQVCEVTTARLNTFQMGCLQLPANHCNKSITASIIEETRHCPFDWLFTGWRFLLARCDWLPIPGSKRSQAIGGLWRQWELTKSKADLETKWWY